MSLKSKFIVLHIYIFQTIENEIWEFSKWRWMFCSTTLQEDELIAIMQKIYMLKNAIYKLADQLFTPA